jgi:uncharacterized protein with von Willebrand factor type A (vWA) domain
MEAIKHIPLEDREAFKYALAATLVKSAAHWKAFETVFEVYFSMRGREYTIGTPTPTPSSSSSWTTSSRARATRTACRGWCRRLDGVDDAGRDGAHADAGADARRRGADARPRPPGRSALRRDGAGRPVGGTYYLYRTLRNLDLDGMLEKLMAATKEEVGGELTPLEERLERDEFSDRIEQFKKEIEAEIRRKLVADRGAEAMAKTLRKPLPEDVEFMHASRDEMQNLKKALGPLTRKLAARLTRKRRHGRKGPLDFRNTVRHSLSYGGVPSTRSSSTPRPRSPS